jgi:hypothetical protein
MEALEMDEHAARDALRSAGYAPLPTSAEPAVSPRREVPERRVLERSSASSYEAALRRPGRLDISQAREVQRAMLLRQMQELLEDADVSDERWEKAVILLDTVLDFVRYRLEREH